MPSYNEYVDLLRESPTRAINRIMERLKREGKDLILFSAGEPGIPPPREVREWISSLLLEDSMRLYSYTPSTGFRDLREAIAEDLMDLGGFEISPDQIVVTSGGQGAIFSTFSTIVSDGDEVILIDPTFFVYRSILPYLRARVKYVPAYLEKGFQPDVNAIQEIVKRGRTKAIVIVSPDNPTGRIIDWSVARALAEIAVENDLWIVYDEPYKTLVYEREHVYLYKLAPENVIALNAFSKDPGVPGWRLGYVYGPESIVRRIGLVSEATIYHPSSVAQYMVLRYLRDRDLRKRHIEFVRRVYRERRDIMIDELSKVRGVRFVKPEGSMFILADLSEIMREKNLDATRFSERLLEEKLVAVIPGEFFGETTRMSIRLSFTTESPERIREGVKRIREALEEI